MCWPSTAAGGDGGWLRGQLERGAQHLERPGHRVLDLRTISRAATCGCARAAGTVLTGPAGTPALFSVSVHSAQQRPASASVISGISVSRFRTRSGLVAKRGSSASSARPMAPANRRHSPSLPTATISGASAVGSTWYGVRLSCALPCGPA